MRYSHIDLRDNDVGNSSSAGLIGLNIHLSPNLKLMMNMNFSWATGDIINQYQDGRAYSIRAQLTF
jgi:phosphate-selective porin